MESKIAELSGDALELIRKAERKLGETGRDLILIAYEPGQ